MNQFVSRLPDGVGSTDRPGYDALERMAASAGEGSQLDVEFQAALADVGDGFSRRRWLQLMGASLALGAASTGCRHPDEHFAPYAFRPVGRVPGIPVQYNTAMDFAGVARPLRAISFDGRPIKLDGNPEHPDCGGGSDTFTQARILELYDPDRLRTCRRKDGERQAELERDEAIRQLQNLLSGSSLAGVAILAEPSSSPTMARLQKQFESRGGRWFVWHSLGDDHQRAGTRAAFGRAVRPQYHFDQAAVIVALDADPLGVTCPGSISNSRRFAAGRDADHGRMSRLYVAESEWTVTGAAADHRLAVRSSRIRDLVAALAEEIGKRKKGDRVSRQLPWQKRIVAAMAQDLLDHPGKGIIIAGERQPPEVHAMVHWLNEQLGNHGDAITFTELPDADRPLLLESAVELAGSIESGSVRSLVIVGGNPVYDFPGNIDLAAALRGLANCVHLTVHANETSAAASLVINVAHPLESWGDGLAHDGSLCIAQPLIAPLFGGQSPAELLSSAMGGTADGQALVRETVQPVLTAGTHGGDGEVEAVWYQAVHDGFVRHTEAPAVSVKAAEVSFPVASDAWCEAWDGRSLEMVFTPSRSVYDGRFANSAWMQELPDFFTKIAWDNAAVMNPATARQLGLKQNYRARFEVAGKQLDLPVHVIPGLADGTIAVETGFGRTAAGRVGGDVANGVDPVGVSVAPVRTVGDWYFSTAVQCNGRGGKYTLASVQELWETDRVGADEIQARMFIDPNGNRSQLIRESTFESWQEFQKEHPPGAHGHEAAPSADHSHASTGLPRGVLPVIGSIPVSLASARTDVPSPSGRDTRGHDHGDHAPQWPQGYPPHLHTLKDLTPGVSHHYNPNGNNKWGMSIDLNACTGCSACVVACQAENNIPIVGKWQVWRGREMHWLRIDRYFGTNVYNQRAAIEGDYQVAIQPVTCHQCENAPCETVCPVAATVHSDEGLNDMVYNRCIGTRYCGNNCPYKVRRFNYLNYTDAETFLKYPGADRLSASDRSLQNLMMNPEVTIRSRGVMEKCTYCVQRIQNTKIRAKVEQRAIGANEITTACQDACPTHAIRFGDLLNHDSDVAAAHASPRSYVMLEELNNRPRTKYLARVRNPHPALVDWDDRGPANAGRIGAVGVGA